MCIRDRFKIGDYVFVRAVKKPHQSSKLCAKFDGPYIVQCLRGPNKLMVYCLESGRTFPVHVDNAKVIPAEKFTESHFDFMNDEVWNPHAVEEMLSSKEQKGERIEERQKRSDPGVPSEKEEERGEEEEEEEEV